MIELKKFHHLEDSEKEIILSWRNHENIRKWMYHDAKISRKEHFEFIENLKNVQDKLYFLVIEDGSAIGVIDFTNITKESAVFGLYQNPNLKGKGKILIQASLDYACHILMINKVILEVFAQNKKAIELYEKFGFIKYDVKIQKEQKVVCMEYKNENS